MSGCVAGLVFDRQLEFSFSLYSLTILDVYPEGAIAEVIGDTSHLAPSPA